MKILLATDGSNQGLKAARFLMKNPGILGSKPDVLVLNVDLPLGRSLTTEVGVEAADRYHAESSEMAMRSTLALFKRAGVPCRAVALTGDPATIIAHVAKSKHRQMIVMGSHGHGTLGRLLLGSVTAKTMSLSEVPVLVVR
ncbi:MAG: universal stress protein [Dokdonella sp.]|uniref:universal stress protein n=1 Tax=Dokdonella sp. TaxID=2291710 RepID=UPI003264036E